MKNLFITIICVLGILATSGCVYAVRYDGPYEGRVIDADTREPIEGVVVLGTWDREYTGAGGAIHEYYDAMETVTDQNGDFEIKGLGLLIMSDITPMNVLIFKTGYKHLGIMTWRGLKTIVKWEDDRAIIQLKKLTMEQRRRNIPPPPPGQAPKEKVILMLKEMDKDLKDQGMEPFRETSWR